MPDLSTLVQPDRGQPARTIHLIDAKGFDAWLAAQPPRHRTAAQAQKLAPTGYSSAILPGDGPEDWSVVTVVANVERLTPWCLAKLADTLPEGIYRIDGREPGKALYGWLTAQYKFDRYKKKDDKAQGPRVLLTGDPAKMEEALRLAGVTFKLRDRINTGANDMGPADLEAAAADLAKEYGATLTVVKGKEVEKGYGMLWAVGKAAGKGREPRLIELEWGNPEHPRIAIIGKGVCFDSGGLDIKPAGHAADEEGHGRRRARASARRAGDAEPSAGAPPHARPRGREFDQRRGHPPRRRDDLAQGVECREQQHRCRRQADPRRRAHQGGREQSRARLRFRDLTGAARVALGADLQALFANDDTLAAELLAAAEAEADPMWRMPLYDPYKDLLKSDVADLVNAAEGPFGGAITAALFLKEFAPEKAQWAHFDIFCWNGSAKPGRPKGAEAVSLRATWKVLKDRYGG
jgi:leucyl aminopeptidase